MKKRCQSEPLFLAGYEVEALAPCLRFMERFARLVSTLPVEQTMYSKMRAMPVRLGRVGFEAGWIAIHLCYPIVV